MFPHTVTHQSTAVCPKCKSGLRNHTGVNNEDKPKVNELTLCAECGELLVFESIEPTILRFPTESELSGLSQVEKMDIQLARAMLPQFKR